MQRLWYSRNNKERPAKLRGALEGEELKRWWDQQTGMHKMYLQVQLNKQISKWARGMGMGRGHDRRERVSAGQWSARDQRSRGLLLRRLVPRHRTMRRSPRAAMVDGLSDDRSGGCVHAGRPRHRARPYCAAHEPSGQA